MPYTPVPLGGGGGAVVVVGGTVVVDPDVVGVGDVVAGAGVTRVPGPAVPDPAVADPPVSGPADDTVPAVAPGPANADGRLVADAVVDSVDIAPEVEPVGAGLAAVDPVVAAPAAPGRPGPADTARDPPPPQPAPMSAATAIPAATAPDL